MTVHLIDVTARARGLATKGDPEEPYLVPSEGMFGDDEFIAAKDLAEIGDALIRQYPARFGFLVDRRVDYLWKAKGGETNGKATLGKCQKPGGVLAYFSGADFVIWAAADHAQVLGLTRWQVEALVFHELSHCGEDGKTGALKVWAHDFAGFRRELEVYGPWTADLKDAGRVFQQLPLFDEDEGEGSE